MLPPVPFIVWLATGPADAGQLHEPPRVSVLDAGLTVHDGARLQRRFHPGLGQHLLTFVANSIQIELTQGQQIATSQAQPAATLRQSERKTG